MWPGGGGQFGCFSGSSSLREQVAPLALPFGLSLSLSLFLALSLSLSLSSFSLGCTCTSGIPASCQCSASHSSATLRVDLHSVVFGTIDGHTGPRQGKAKEQCVQLLYSEAGRAPGARGRVLATRRIRGFLHVVRQLVRSCVLLA